MMALLLCIVGLIWKCLDLSSFAVSLVATLIMPSFAR
jgi:hypothetical protein